MKTLTAEWMGLQKNSRFLFCSNNRAIAAMLVKALQDIGVLTQEDVPQENLARRLVELGPQLLFLDFTVDPSEPKKLLRSAELARLLARIAPNVPRIAVGRESEPEGAIAALRAGITEFVDPSLSADEVGEVARRMLATAAPLAVAGGVRKSVLLLGARPGTGTSTLAVHLAGLVQQRLLQSNVERRVAAGEKPAKTESIDGSLLPLEQRVGVLDLGWPVGDCLLYLNLQSEFDFAEAVRNLRRLDPTLLGAAMAHTKSGISVLALPRDMSGMRGVSQPDSLLLFDRLRQHFGLLVIDAGGSTNPEFVLGLARASEETWLVSDQSVGSLVSLAEMIKEFDQQHIERESLRLVINKYDERYGMTGAQIAERFNIPLAGTLPDRTYSLMCSSNEGRLLHEISERDPYVRSVQLLAEKLCAQPSLPAGRSSWVKNWLPGVQRNISPR
jgi:pilus assembly protein CpaE